MRRMQRVAIVAALAVGGLALLVTTLAADAAPPAEAAQIRFFPGASPCNTTLQACIDGSNPGDEIRIQTGTYITSITLNKGVSLMGAGAHATVLEGLPGQRALTVTAAVTDGTRISLLTLRGGGLATGNGGAVLVEAGAEPTFQFAGIMTGTVTGSGALGGGLYTEAPLVLNEVFFYYNAAPNGYGGGLASAPGVALTLVNPAFLDNTAGEQGGGVYAGGHLTVTGGGFDSNQALDAEGGAAYVNGDLWLSGVSVSGNQSGLSGGALLVTGTTTIENALFMENRSPNGAGAALRAIGPAHISGTQFISNTSRNQGGAVRTSAAAYVTDTDFISNTTTNNDAGALDVIGDAYIAGGTFMANSTPEQGGGARVLGTLVLSGTQFVGNTAGQQGGGLRVFTATVQNAVFENNAVLAGNGGGLWAGNELTVSHSTFRFNAVLSGTSGSGTGRGGGIFGGGFVASQDNTFVENHALRLGGGMDADDLASMGDVFRENSTGQPGEGGGLRVLTATVQNAVFENNTVIGGNGGGVWAGNVLTVSQSLFRQNTVLSGTQPDGTGSGGGIFGDGFVASQDNTFVENYALRLGGGMYADDLVSVRDVFRENGNGPMGSGGGLFVAGEFEVDSGQFFTNTSNTAGGLGVNSSARGVVNNSLFAGNVVTFANGGAAMRLLSTTSVTLTHNTLVGTNAAGRSAVHMQGAGDFFFRANLIANHALGLVQFVSPPTSTATSQHTVFFSVTVPYAGPVITDSTDLTGTVIFRNPAAGDYRLAEGSVAIDYAPDYGLPTDFEGDPRPFGGGFDVGFDEASPAKLFLVLIER